MAKILKRSFLFILFLSEWLLAHLNVVPGLRQLLYRVMFCRLRTNNQNRLTCICCEGLLHGYKSPPGVMNVFGLVPQW
ncbi:hypothetical protein SAMN05216299_10974 [Nitrosospira sp. Nsp14]|nr:hypothetical protein SAMN05216299_10974 [Nitrosospira sp. Nsp14]